jgi:RNA polymerase sigma factor (sigma-70 family)
MRELKQVREAARAVTSLDTPVGDDGETPLGDLVASAPDAAADEVSSAIERDRMRRAVSALPDDEREVIVLRFGLQGDDPKTLQQVADELGSTRDRVRRIERDAMRRLEVELGDLREAV